MKLRLESRKQLMAGAGMAAFRAARRLDVDTWADMVELRDQLRDNLAAGLAQPLSNPAITFKQARNAIFKALDLHTDGCTKLALPIKLEFQVLDDE